MVPLIDGLRRVQSLVALEPDQRPTAATGQRLGHLGLSHPGLALEQEGALHPQRQEVRGGEPLVREVSLVGKGLGDVGDGADLHGSRLRVSPRLG